MTKPIFPHEIRSFAGMHELVELALDLRWSWNHGADDIWRRLASELSRDLRATRGTSSKPWGPKG